MNKKQLRNKLHAKRQIQYQANVNARLHKYQPKDTVIGNLMDLGYQPNVGTFTIDQHYDQIIKPVIKNITNQKIEYNQKDNRTLLPELDYAHLKYPYEDYNTYCGMVTASKVKIKGNDIHLYLLLTNVQAKVHYRHKLRYRQCTDHLWIELAHDMTSYWTPDHPGVTISLGDQLRISAKVGAYRGYREGIRQTKYGLEDIVVMDSGYPKLQLNNRYSGGVALHSQTCVPYNHHDNFIVQYCAPQKYPTSVVQFGNQIDKQVPELLQYSQYNFGDMDEISLRPMLTPGLNTTRPMNLVLNLSVEHKPSLFWQDANVSINKKDRLIGTSQELQTLGLDTFYQQIAKQHRWRYKLD